MLRAGCDAIVNPANSALMHGAGAAKAIRDAAGGATFDAECRDAMKAASLGPGGVPAGRALRTSSCGLRATHGIMHVVHAVGERWQSGRDNTVAKMLLRSAVTALTEAAIAGATLRPRLLWWAGHRTALRARLASIAHWAAEPAARQQAVVPQRIVLVDTSNSCARAR